MTRIVSLTLFSLMLLAGSAFAECAWVLWTESEASSRDKVGNWKQASFNRYVYETRKACELALVRSMENEVRGWRKAGTKVFDVGEVSSDEKGFHMRVNMPMREITEVYKERAEGVRDFLVHRYTCLPDTLDPRGPKG